MWQIVKATAYLCYCKIHEPITLMAYPLYAYLCTLLKFGWYEIFKLVNPDIKKYFIKENAFQCVFHKIAATLLRDQLVNMWIVDNSANIFANIHIM